MKRLTIPAFAIVANLIETRNQRLDQGGRHGNDDEGSDGA